MRTLQGMQVWLQAIAAAALAGLATVAPIHAGAGRPPAAPCPAGDHFTVVAERHYTVAVRIRPLLFWIRRDDVGDARLTWSAAPGGATRIALLIGSDPARAPMRINRWGYIAETTCGATTTVVGVMSESDEQSVEEAQARVTGGAGSGHAFKAIRSCIVERESFASVTRLVVPEDLTFRDLDVLLRRVPEDTPVNRRMPTQGIGQGFLAAANALVHESVDACASTGGCARHRTASRPFVHGDRAYDMKVRSSSLRPAKGVATAVSSRLLDIEVEVRNRTAGHVTRFWLTCGAEGPLAGVPVRIVYRPRWWFEVDLRLAGPRGGGTAS